MSTRIAWSLTEHSLLYLLFYGGAAVLALQTGSPLRKWRYGTLAPPWRVLRHELWYGVSSMIIVSLYDAAIRWDIDAGHGFTRVDPKLTLSPAALTLWILCAALLAEAHFYWTHRMLHASSWLYRNVHKVHHVSHDPNPLSGISFHPVEGAIYCTCRRGGARTRVAHAHPPIPPSGPPDSLVPTRAVAVSSVLCGVLLLPMSLRLYHAWRIALFLFPISGHIGLGNGKSPLCWPFHMIAQYHYVHHTRTHCNFGGFILWDWLCGTDLDAWERREAARKPQPLPPWLWIAG